MWLEMISTMTNKTGVVGRVQAVDLSWLSLPAEAGAAALVFAYAPLSGRTTMMLAITVPIERSLDANVLHRIATNLLCFFKRTTGRVNPDGKRPDGRRRPLTLQDSRFTVSNVSLSILG